MARTYGLKESDIFELEKAFESQYHKLLKEEKVRKEKEPMEEEEKEHFLRKKYFS